MLQYYLRAEGLLLSWIGTGRLIFSLNYSDADFAAVVDRFVAAASAMQRDGWWWRNPALTDRTIKRTVLKEIIGEHWARLRRTMFGDRQRPA
jgi:glutamate-1-semialdehyde 2,1-aminomutase